MIALFIQLILAHLIGDFLIQPDKWVKDKKEKKHKSKYLYLHTVIHALALIVLLQFDAGYWLGITVITLSHLLIDTLKLNLEKKINERVLFFTDQVAHVGIIFMVVGWYHTFSFDFSLFYQSSTLLLLAAIIMETSVAAIIIKVIITKWSLEEDAGSDSLKNAGKYIGMLERLFVFGFIVFNQWQAIGFLLAAKSVFRFGDLSKAKDRKLTEYILIGTLLSFGMAIMVAIAYLQVKKQLA